MTVRGHVVSIAGDGWKHKIELDGHEIQNAVTKLTYHVVSGELPRLELDLALNTGQVSGADVVVTVPAWTRDALIALGWTPPGDSP